MIISLGYSDALGGLDIVPATGDSLTWLNNAISISLFTDARASDDDTLPDSRQDRRGYWGDMDLDDNQSLGSKLWLLSRSKITQDTLNAMHDYLTEAVQWLIDEGHLLAIKVTVERDTQGIQGAGDQNRVNFRLDCQLNDGEWVSVFRAHEITNGDE
ncbi:phage GP46 family protein [Marinomonas transparens]|uniref:Phage GP46 family protein n=1 Tax=Marinomonas transparens TaxID=2795388 RepID=A0A934N1W5_9GAMM|nr:phage GP46 family protein [Marinomonas transparens]MBJ7537158.1 phage GP46 family protein [Marinomonas transparens]